LVAVSRPLGFPKKLVMIKQAFLKFTSNLHRDSAVAASRPLEFPKKLVMIEQAFL